MLYRSPPIETGSQQTAGFGRQQAQKLQQEPCVADHKHGPARKHGLAVLRSVTRLLAPEYQEIQHAPGLHPQVDANASLHCP